MSENEELFTDWLADKKPLSCRQVLILKIILRNLEADGSFVPKDLNKEVTYSNFAGLCLWLEKNGYLTRQKNVKGEGHSRVRYIVNRANELKDYLDSIDIEKLPDYAETNNTLAFGSTAQAFNLFNQAIRKNQGRA